MPLSELTASKNTNNTIGLFHNSTIQPFNILSLLGVFYFKTESHFHLFVADRLYWMDLAFFITFPMHTNEDQLVIKWRHLSNQCLQVYDAATSLLYLAADLLLHAEKDTSILPGEV